MPLSNTNSKHSTKKTCKKLQYSNSKEKLKTNEDDIKDSCDEQEPEKEPEKEKEQEQETLLQRNCEVKDPFAVDDLQTELDNIETELDKQPCIVKKHTLKDYDFWEIFKNPHSLQEISQKVSYLLQEFGTILPCNRFDVGNCIEFIINDAMKGNGFEISELPNANRVDVDIQNYKQLSIKFSSSGDITLHNSNSSINTDLTMKDTILLTKTKLYLITNEELKNRNIDIENFIKNSGDSLKLKRSILNELKKSKYPYVCDIDIIYDKKKCKNRLCSKVVYEQFKKEYSNK